MTHKPLIVAIGGTLRPGSSTERALQICLDEAEKAGARTELLKGVDLTLPPYNPEDPVRSPQAMRLVQLIRECDGLIIGSPGYHGSISGMIKNALDYTEDLRSDDRVYLDSRAVGCVACGAGWQSIGSTLAALRSIVHALRGWPTPLGAGINTAVKTFDPDGRCLDPAVENQLRLVGQQVVRFVEAFGSIRKIDVAA
ncbi:MULTISPECIES: NADPH-dependent FMN reductase [unclassified Sinorhizobium]|uniref:NADPH-dependent FMN reductase n=1 Tax=unclassified Sinorhizobium TaxID=2613772 RepID=UPI003526C213